MVLTSRVSVRSPVPQDVWVFQTRSVGGLWTPPPPDDHTYRVKGQTGLVTDGQADRSVYV